MLSRRVDPDSLSEGGYFSLCSAGFPGKAECDVEEKTLLAENSGISTTAVDKACGHHGIRVDPHAHTWSRAVAASLFVEFTTLYTRLAKWKKTVLRKIWLRGDSA